MTLMRKEFGCRRMFPLIRRHLPMRWFECKMSCTSVLKILRLLCHLIFRKFIVR
jgi:hypothetical protein